MRTLHGIFSSAIVFAATNCCAAPFTLSCSMHQGEAGAEMTRTYSIDEDRQTVDGQPAAFTTNEISFDAESPIRGVRGGHTISRINGHIDVQLVSLRAAPIIGHCDRVLARTP